MTHRLNVEEAAGILSRSSSFSLIYHQNPDGDCLCSSLSLYYWLSHQGKYVEVIDDKCIFPKAFESDMAQVRMYSANQAKKDSVIILLDCAEGKRTTLLEPDHFLLHREVLVIDHHQSAYHSPFNAWIDTSAAATGEMLAVMMNYIPEYRYPLSEFYAFVAIVSDTGFFRYANTTSRTMLIAAELHQDTSEIYKQYFLHATLEDTRLLGEILTRFSYENGVLYTYIDATELHVLQQHERTNDVLDAMQKIKEAEVHMLFKEATPGKWRISLRQGRLNKNLAHFAEAFSGGGHHDAAAFAMPGDLFDVKHKVFSKWKEFSSL